MRRFFVTFIIVMLSLILVFAGFLNVDRTMKDRSGFLKEETIFAYSPESRQVTIFNKDYSLHG